LELTRKDLPPQIDSGISPGQECEVSIGDQPILKGYIDVLNTGYDSSSTRITVSGRDATGDLIDCAAAVDGPFEFNNIKLEKFVEKILKPFNISLTVLADTGAPFKRIAIQPGETAYELIDRVCRFRAVLPISDGVGGMLIIKPGGLRSEGFLERGKNILSGDFTVDWKDRFALYVVKGQSEANAETSSAEAATGEGRATDALVGRYRPTVITGENQGYNMTLSQRAEWQAQFARARSVKVSYDVQGWYAKKESSSLWLPNSIVPLKDPVFGFSRDMLITTVSFRRSNQGTFTSLELCLPEAFDLPAEIEADSDDIAGNS
jgi:prophage tail gpP-like protein